MTSFSSAAGVWSSWEGDCNVECGEGRKYMTRKCEVDPYLPPGDYCPPTCPGEDKKDEYCYPKCCKRKLVFLGKNSYSNVLIRQLYITKR
jgi:hypothetical protein